MQKGHIDLPEVFRACLREQADQTMRIIKAVEYSMLGEWDTKNDITLAQLINAESVVIYIWLHLEAIGLTLFLLRKC